MRAETFEIVTVASGARSLRSLEHGETFHPVVGPMSEARELHVRQQRIVERAAQPGRRPFVIWDAGLGAAANALAAIGALENAGAATRPVELHSFDRTRAPLDFALNHAAELGYFAGREKTVAALLRDGIAMAGPVTWRLHEGDFRERMNDPAIPPPHAVMFDPYSPSANPELWQLDTFAALRRRATGDEPCTLTSYSRSTAVRVTLLLAGWFVGHGGATGEKDETTIAATRLDLLDEPLGARWLQRVRRSTAPGPLGAPGREPLTSAEVTTRLLRHPQFLPPAEG
jgi:tRNA U34 5-methylaminomethyl-2-thiouridine-forming methyltransferase MnmC